MVFLLTRKQNINYDAKQFYAVYPGLLVQDRYEMFVKLGWGRYSTVWLALAIEAICRDKIQYSYPIGQSMTKQNTSSLLLGALKQFHHITNGHSFARRLTISYPQNRMAAAIYAAYMSRGSRFRCINDAGRTTSSRQAYSKTI